jgi:glycosidase
MPSLKNPYRSFLFTRDTFVKSAFKPDADFSITANARELAHKLALPVPGGEIAALSLLGKIFQHVIQRYQDRKNPDFASQALTWLSESHPEESLQETFVFILEHFPLTKIYDQSVSPAEFLSTETEDCSPKQALVVSLIMLELAIENPAFDHLSDLVRDNQLEEQTDFSDQFTHFEEFTKTQPPFGPQNQSLLELLRSPIKASPNSIMGQLEYIQRHWGEIIGEEFQRQLLRSLDVIREEQKMGFLGAGPVQPPDLDHLPPDEVRFSPDLDWMPKVVLIAKNIYVWLDQLSKKYQRAITKLDQIPEEELEQLASWGFTGLWLIGLWERSPASKRIKQMCGNPEAVSSAYSLYDYVIAQDLGGQASYQQLRDKANRHGIHLAADMVPNHVGIYSRWVVEHPGWFLALDHKPFPSYTYHGPNLSDDDRVGVYIEDHYYDRTDAAVVFKRVDHETGDVRYIYHGNDGTAMPWNDTAQLNYLKEEVREAVIQTILHVARHFPIIRFDAAMTLAKRHYQRLWFPKPGAGGDIPTRAEHGMTKEEFNQAFPKEFWREVVDRVAEETPNTLLLAEAFWMMEGYFVRTLGMHRVYNSAFMNMLRDEKNPEYRELILKTLDFDPQILKRYVNFMNNPDEETAISQFGKDDKYFGICTLMCTMPGLPMFGHGQIEGFTEKYGMEYKRAYYNETVNENLVARHQKQIFPLLHKRYLFSEVDHFVLYDFMTTSGNLDQNVFAYSNRRGEERALVIYYNKWGDVQGWVRSSASLDGSSMSLGEGLDLVDHPQTYVIFRDHISNLEYIRPASQLFEKGLYVELGAYHTHLFLDFRQVSGENYQDLHDALDGAGVYDIERKRQEIRLKPVLKALEQLISPLYYSVLFDPSGTLPADAPSSDVIWDRFSKRLPDFFAQVIKTCPDTTRGAQDLIESLSFSSLQTLKGLSRLLSDPDAPQSLSPETQTLDYYLFYLWSVVRELGQMISTSDSKEQSCQLLHELMLTKPLADILDLPEPEHKKALNALRIMIRYQDWCSLLQDPEELLDEWLSDPDIQQLLHIHDYQETTWFQKEGFERFLDLMRILAVLQNQGDSNQLQACQDFLTRLNRAKGASDYRVRNLKAALAEGT